jgi:hypothetical protein
LSRSRQGKGAQAFNLGVVMSFLLEFLKYVKVRKKYWLLPVFIVMGLFGVLIVLTQGSAVAPFIYTLF